MELVVYIFLLLLSFYILAKIVDEYFVDSLDIIAKKWNMSSDAAGATLMALGSSAPELFVAVFAVLLPGENNEHIGIGSIVGSAIFNILVITGATAIVRSAKLAWKPVIRDMLFYCIAIGLLVWVFVTKKLTLWDAIIFISVYILYVIVVVNWKRIYPSQTAEVETNTTPKPKDNQTKQSNGFLKLLLFPIDKFFSLIMPSMKYYVWVFVLSIVIIAGLSFVLVESAVEISEVLHIPKAIVALTVLAIGTSIPDLLSSIIVSKEGRGGMAISNGIGSNIFDILIGLGVPFLLMIILSGGNIALDADNLLLSSMLLFSSVAITLGTFVIMRWKIGRGIGFFFIFLYIVYLGWEIYKVIKSP